MAITLGTLHADIQVNTADLDAAQAHVSSTTNSMGKMFRRLGLAVAGYFSAAMVKNVIMTADKMRVLEGRIKRITVTSKGFDDAWKGINDSADAAGVSIEQSAKSFERFLIATQGMGVSIAGVVKFNDLVLKTGTISGASSVELGNALTQLSQSFQGGIIRAEEWNSIIEQAPEILRVAARNIKGVDGDLGKLRKVMLAGELTADKFFNAFMEGADDVEKEFNKIPQSIEQGMQKVTNQFVRLATELDKTMLLTTKISATLSFWADQLDESKRHINNLTDSLKTMRGVMKSYENQINVLERTGLNPKELERVKKKLKEVQDQYRKTFNELNPKGGKEKPEDARAFVATEEDVAEGPVISDKALEKRRKQMSKAREDGLAFLKQIEFDNASAEKQLILKKDEAAQKVKEHAKNGVIFEAEKNASLLALEETFQADMAKLKEDKAAKDKAAKDDAIAFLRDIEFEAADSEGRLFMLRNETAKKITKLREEELIDVEAQGVAMYYLDQKFEADRQELKDEAAAADEERRKAEIDAIANLATTMGDLMGAISSDASSGLGKAAAAFRTFAVSLVASSQAIAAAQTLSKPEDNLATKLGKWATIIGAFATITSSISGGRVNGGGMTEGKMYAVGEGGKSEILNEGGKQYLIAGKNASITGNGALKQANSSTSNSNSAVIQQNITVSGTGDAELIRKMGLAAEQGAKMAESNFKNQMSQKSGPMFKAVQQNYGSGRTRGRAV